MTHLLTLLLLLSPLAQASPMQFSDPCDKELSVSLSTFEIWQEKVKTQRVIDVDLPYMMTPRIKMQFQRMSVRLPAGFKGRLGMAYFAREESVIPTQGMVESWHGIVRYFKGYYYAITFTSKENRERFLREFNDVYVTEGEWRSDDRDLVYGIFLTPNQFLRLTEQMNLEHLFRDYTGFRPSTWSEIEELQSAHSTLRNGTVYYFDNVGKVVGMRDNGRFFRYVQPTDTSKKNVASHASILAKQNPLMDISRFLPKSGTEISNGMGASLRAADIETERIERQFNDFLNRPVNQVAGAALAEVEQSVLSQMTDEENLVAKMRSRTGGFTFYLLKYLNLRRELLKQMLKASSPANSEVSTTLIDDVGGDLTKIAVVSQDEMAKLPADLRSGMDRLVRFVWIKDVPLNIGFVYSAKGLLLHQQILKLLLGEKIFARFASMPQLLRGGVMKVSYDDKGQAARFAVLQPNMNIMVASDQALKVSLDTNEQANLAMSLTNATADIVRPPRRK